MYEYGAKVARVVDGDTIVVDVDVGFDLWKHGCVLRLARVDTPEMRGEEREAGQKAKERVQALMEQSGHEVRIRTISKDSFGRWLAEVELPDSRNLSDVLLEEGHAKLYVK